MATVQAFNGMLKNFVEDIALVTTDTKLQLVVAGFDTFVALDPAKPMRLFNETMQPHAALLTAKDPALFEKITLPGGVDLQPIWSTLSESNREHMWQHLTTLHMVSSTMSQLPPELIQGIETMAEQCAAKVQSGEMDLSSLAGMLMGGGAGGLGSLMSGLMGGLGGGLGDGGIAALAGAGGGGGGSGGGGGGRQRRLDQGGNDKGGKNKGKKGGHRS